MALHQRGFVNFPAFLGIKVPIAALFEHRVPVLRYNYRAVFNGLTIRTDDQNHPGNTNWFGGFAVAGYWHLALLF